MRVAFNLGQAQAFHRRLTGLVTKIRRLKAKENRINRASHAMRSLPNTENENARFQGVSKKLVSD